MLRPADMSTANKRLQGDVMSQAPVCCARLQREDAAPRPHKHVIGALVSHAHEHNDITNPIMLSFASSSETPSILRLIVEMPVCIHVASCLSVRRG